MEKPENYICSDAGCSYNPGGRVYYRVVDIMKDEVVAEKEFPQGTCNIGEYLAIIEALQYRQKEGLDDIPIYSDSLIGIKRVREKRHRCKSDITERPQVAEEIKRQEEWLRDYTGSRNIHFRETKEWGDIPADYGKKEGGRNLYPRNTLEKKKNVTVHATPPNAVDSRSNIQVSSAEKRKIKDNINNGRITKEFYGASYNAMKKIANNNQLMFAMLFANGVTEEESYMAVFPECKILYTETIHDGKMTRVIPDMLEIRRRAKQYAGCLPVKTICGMLLRNEVEMNYSSIAHDKEGILKILWYTLGKLNTEVQKGNTGVAVSMKNIAHEIAVLDGHLKEETNTNNYFIGTIGVEQLEQKKLAILQKDTHELENSIEEKVLAT